MNNSQKLIYFSTNFRYEVFNAISNLFLWLAKRTLSCYELFKATAIASVDKQEVELGRLRDLANEIREQAWMEKDPD